MKVDEEKKTTIPLTGQEYLESLKDGREFGSMAKKKWKTSRLTRLFEMRPVQSQGSMMHYMMKKQKIF